MLESVPGIDALSPSSGPSSHLFCVLESMCRDITLRRGTASRSLTGLALRIVALSMWLYLVTYVVPNSVTDSVARCGLSALSFKLQATGLPPLPLAMTICGVLGSFRNLLGRASNNQSSKAKWFIPKNLKFVTVGRRSDDLS